METPINVTKIERIDDVPLLLAQMEKMQVSTLLDQYFPMHGNWKGLSLGQVTVVWLAYILSEGDHRLNSVQGWAAGLLMTLTACLKAAGLRELDFSDDRLAGVLDSLGRDDTAWERYESEQNATLLRVYDLEPRRVRLDTTTAKSYVAVTEGGLFQFGHSKEHRPDLPQLKISQAVLDPLGLPLSTTVVSGECADDPLYVPEIAKVRAGLGRSGLLYVGDCKMGSLETRAYLAGQQDYYLCPLSKVALPTEALQALLAPVWAGTQALTPVYRPPETPLDRPEQLANGFSYTVTLEAELNGERIVWQERRWVVQSLKHAAAQHKALDTRLAKAGREIQGLNQRGPGRKQRGEEEMRAAVEAILARHEVTGLLDIAYQVDTQTVHKRAYRARPAQEVSTVTVTVRASRRTAAYEAAVRELGWRVLVSNDLGLGLDEAVPAYREQYIVERGFSRFRGKLLGLTPLYLSSTTRIKGLIRLLSIALRVLGLVEFTVRKALRKQGEKLDGIYAGNAKRATAKPTTEMMLRAFAGLNLAVVSLGEANYLNVTPLNPTQLRILALLEFPVDIYQGLNAQFDKVAGKLSEP